MNEYICHSGGCEGADMAWEEIGYHYNVNTIAYSFYNHRQHGRNQKILTTEELHEGYTAARIASKSINKPFDTIQYPYIKNLLARNWFQVKNSEAIFAIAKSLLTNTIVEGGTGWAVQMAIDCDKPVYVWVPDSMDVTGGYWCRYKPVVGFEGMRGEIPKLTKNFAGIGTRDLSDAGLSAIADVYKNTFGDI